MADMHVGWVPPLDCQFFFWLDTTLALSGISIGISKPHSAAFFIVSVKIPPFRAIGG